MKHLSTQRRREVNATREAREQMRLDHYVCAVPWCRHPASDIHEIARGPHRRKAYQERCAWLYLCRTHHDAMGDYSVWPVARQIAVKAIADGEWYDRVRVNELRGRAPDAISEREVIEQVVWLFERIQRG